jgi:hypothetical protein
MNVSPIFASDACLAFSANGGGARPGHAGSVEAASEDTPLLWVGPRAAIGDAFGEAFGDEKLEIKAVSALVSYPRNSFFISRLSTLARCFSLLIY